MSKKNYKIDFGFIGTSIWLTLILAILKIAGIIDIGVWWVLSPIIISFGLTLIVMSVIFLLILNSIMSNVDDEDDEDKEEGEEQEE